MTQRILVVMQPDGGFDVVTDEPAEVICVSDHTPGDRLYLLTDSHRVGRDLVDEIIGTHVIGSADDGRHEALANRIRSAWDGKPHLKPVK